MDKQEKKPDRRIDWEIIERDYRAGIKTLRQIATEHGITHGAVNKRAKADGWDRDLQPKIAAKVAAKVSKALVSKMVSADTKATERQVVEANAEIIAQADLINRKDVLLALDVSRSQLEEVALLSSPDFRASLVWLGELMDRSSESESGREIPDKVNELYRYIIGLAGRVKMSKEIAASHGVYIPMQRKILKLDNDADSRVAQVDALLANINASAD